MGGNQLPLWLKIAWTALIVVIVPIYLHEYGPSNFLWELACPGFRPCCGALSAGRATTL